MDVGMMMGFNSYGWDDCSDQRVWDEKSASRGSPPISASTVCGRPNITSTTTRSSPTTSS